MDWYKKAIQDGYSSYIDNTKGIVVLDNEGNIVYQLKRSSPKFHSTNPQQVLAEYYRDWGPHVTAEPQNIPTGFNNIGQLSDLDSHPILGNPLENDPYDEYNDTEVLQQFSPDSIFSQTMAKKNPLVPAFVKKKIQDTVHKWQMSARRHGTTAPKNSARTLGPETLQGTRYIPQAYSYGEVINVLDLETVGTSTTKGSILSYAVIKKAHNLDTGNWDIVSKRTRYYYPTKEDYLLTDAQGVPVYDPSIGISGLTPENIKARRDQQLAKYSKHFNKKELDRLLTFIGTDPVVGQNISQFDWPKLMNISLAPGTQIPRHLLPKGGLIDVLHLAEGTRGTHKGLNTNEVLFTLAYGKTPREFGFTAHDALEDTQITAMVYEAMLKDPSRMGVIARYINHHPGLSTQFRDLMINGPTEVRDMTPQGEDVLRNILKQAGTENIADVMPAEDAANVFSGYATRQQQLQTIAGTGGGDVLGTIEELKELKSALSRLTSAIEGNTKQGMASSTVVREAASLNTIVERKQYLHSVLGVTGDPEAEDWNADRTVAGYALKRANALYKAKHKGLLEMLSPEESAPVGWADPREHAALWNARHIPGGDFKTIRDAGYTYGDVNSKSEWRIADINKLHAGGGFTRAGKAGQGYIDNNLWAASSSQLDKAVGFSAQQLVALGKIAGEVADQYDKIFSAHQAADKAVYGAASYFIPGFARGASDRFFNAYQAFEQSTHLGRSKWLHLGGDLLQGIGHAKAGNVQAAGTSIVRGIGNFIQGSVMQKGLDKVSRIDLWSGFSELLLIPLRLAGNALKSLTSITLRLGRSFLNVIASFRNLGIPLTNLTGVTYRDMQRSYVGDAMIGAGNGSMNASYNTFAGAQQDLYTFGQMDPTRVIAAAMTGTFGSVYGNGGDTQAQYAQTANSILARIKATSDPREKARLMNLAGKIDQNLPTVIQQMQNIGVSDYRSIQSGSWLKGRGIMQYTASTEQRAAYTRAGMEFTGLKESFAESRNMIAERLWSSFGRDLVSGANDVFHLIANGQWKDALEQAKRTGEDFWKKITKAIFGRERTFGDVLGDVKENLKSGFEGLLDWALPVIAKAITKYVDLVCAGWRTIIKVGGSAVDQLVERLSFTRLRVFHDDLGWHIGLKTLQRSTASESEIGLQSTQIVQADDKAARKAGHTSSSYWLQYRSLADIRKAASLYPIGHSGRSLYEDNPLYVYDQEGNPLRINSIEQYENYLRLTQGIIDYDDDGKIKPGTKGWASAYAKLAGTKMPKGIVGRLADDFADNILPTMQQEAKDAISAIIGDKVKEMSEGKKDITINLVISDKETGKVITKDKVRPGETLNKAIERMEKLLGGSIEYQAAGAS